MLAPDIQEAALHLEAVDGAEPMAERALRAVARVGRWASNVLPPRPRRVT